MVIYYNSWERSYLSIVNESIMIDSAMTNPPVPVYMIRKCRPSKSLNITEDMSYKEDVDRKIRVGDLVLVEDETILAKLLLMGL